MIEVDTQTKLHEVTVTWRERHTYQKKKKDYTKKQSTEIVKNEAQIYALENKKGRKHTQRVTLLDSLTEGEKEVMP